MASVTQGDTSPKGPASRQPPEVPADCKSGLDGVQLHDARPMGDRRHSRRSGSVTPALCPNVDSTSFSRNCSATKKGGAEGDLALGASITNYPDSCISFNLGAEDVGENRALE